MQYISSIYDIYMHLKFCIFVQKLPLKCMFLAAFMQTVVALICKKVQFISGFKENNSWMIKDSYICFHITHFWTFWLKNTFELTKTHSNKQFDCPFLFFIWDYNIVFMNIRCYGILEYIFNLILNLYISFAIALFPNIVLSRKQN